MKAVFFSKPKLVEIRDIPEPQIQNDDDVKIKIAYCSICGDDMRIWKGDLIISDSTPIGHEMVGTIVACGKEATKKGWKIGDRVSGNPFLPCGTCYYCANEQSNLCYKIKRMPGTMAEYTVWKASQLCKMPETVSTVSGCFTEPLLCCMHGIDVSEIKQGDSVMIIGAGGTGMILLQLAMLKGASRLTVVEPVESKRQLALQLGAEHVIDPHNENILERASKITEAIGYHIIIEASGITDVLKYVTSLMSRKGTLLLFSIYGVNSKFPIDLLQVSSKELTIRSSYLMPRMLPRAMEILPKLDVESLATKIIDFKYAQEAFEAHMTGLHPRVLLKFD